MDKDEVTALLEYAPELGGSCLRWKVDRRARKVKGQMAGTLRKTGYYAVHVKGCIYLAHRLIWLLNTGAWPEEQLDHIDRNPSNNRIENLRAATQAENQQNQGKYKNNKSGYIGVSWHKQNKKWYAKIILNGKKKHLGYFDTPQEAHDAYARAKAELHEFHPEVNDET